MLDVYKRQLRDEDGGRAVRRADDADGGGVREAEAEQDGGAHGEEDAEMCIRDRISRTEGG